MKVDKTEIKILEHALDKWVDAGMLNMDKAAELKQSIISRQSERQQVAQYFFFIALFCILLAFGAIFINEKLLEKIKAYFSWSNLVISFISAFLSAIWFWYIGKKRKKLNPQLMKPIWYLVDYLCLPPCYTSVKRSMRIQLI